jgi:acetyl esterase
MTAPLRFRLIDTFRRRVLGAGVADMDLADIQAARGPHLGGNALLDWLGERVTGRPRADVVREVIEVPGAAGPLPARLHRPASPHPSRPLVLHLHGGGFVVGGPIQYDWVCGELAHGLGATVVSVDYRKAPEHPAPAAAEDAAAVCRWLLQGGGEALGAPGPMVVGGDSAGGNLSAIAAIAARDAGLDGLVAQLLIYPATDLTMTSASATQLTHEPLLHRSDMEAFCDTYLAGAVAGDDPRVSPLYVASLEGLAPACVQIATCDPLRDEGRAYAEKLEAAGVRVQLTEYAHMPHGFTSTPGLTKQARRAVVELVGFARGAIEDA